MDDLVIITGRIDIWIMARVKTPNLSIAMGMMDFLLFLTAALVDASVSKANEEFVVVEVNSTDKAIERPSIRDLHSCRVDATYIAVLST